MDSQGLEVDQLEYEAEREVVGSDEMGSPYDEIGEMEFAATLREMTDKTQRDQFIGDYARQPVALSAHR